MRNFKKTLWLLLFVLMPYSTSADKVVLSDLSVGAISDGTALAYDCSVGAKLPYGFRNGESKKSFDSSSVTAILPAGTQKKFPTNASNCDATDPITGLSLCEYTCSNFVNIIVTGVSDGTAPAYDCSAGATLPLDPVNGGFDTSSLGVTPTGNSIIIAQSTGVCNTVGSVTSCEYTCDTPTGSACVGQDCVNGETFNGDTIKLKENNTRIRFHDTSIASGLGESWNLEANSSRIEGGSYFDFQTKSLNKIPGVRLVRATDGPIPIYDCSSPLLTTLPDPGIGTIPVGEPLIFPVLADPPNPAYTPAGVVADYNCEIINDFEVHPVLTLGTASNTHNLGNGVAIGNQSDFEANTISVGRAALLRRIANVAKGINTTDLITLERLSDYSVVEDQIAAAALLKQKVDLMNAQLDTLTAEIDVIDLDDDDDGFPDLDEVSCGSDPLITTDTPTDTDGDFKCDNGVDNDDDDDTFTDADELTCGFDPLDNTSVPVDTDGDGMCDAGVDGDDDNDTVADVDDAFPLDKDESVDTDGDGKGNNADNDDDNDGVLDVNDVFPLNSSESIDTDGDGIGNNADTDDDNDGVLDENDAFPLNDAGSIDTDLDGTPNNLDTDDDNDGVLDVDDAFPLDITESVDTDGDGIGNNADSDDDNDNVLDIDDAFSLDINESVDTDGDGVGNNADTDDDNDGVIDTEDEFPLDATRSNSENNSDSGTSSGGGSLSLLGVFILGLISFARRRFWGLIR